MAEAKPKQEKTVIGGSTILLGMLAVPIVIVWLVLATRIIWSATTDPNTLSSIEGLLTALAVITIPVNQLLIDITRSWSGRSSSNGNNPTND
jgi:hypothetical protein